MRLSIKIFLTILLLAFLFLFLFLFDFKMLLADYYYNRTLLTEDWPEVLANYQKVFFFQSQEPFYHQKFALDLEWGLQFYKNDETKIKILDLAINQMEKIKEKDYTIMIYLARLWSQKSRLTQNENDFLQTEEIFAKAAVMAPRMARVYADWCQLRIYQKEWERAKEMCRKAFYLYPSLDHPQMNQEHYQLVTAEMAEVYVYLGEIYANLENYAKAETMYLQALKFFPLARPEIWKKIGDLYYLQGDLDKAIEKNFHGYILRPKDPAWSLALSLLYQEKGDQEKAQFWRNIMGPEI
ncbi:MAG: tetratricopeptide repeat protein [Patescibacteria group bacterium]|nr:tetratricopeptide repeat protein [Patescibacteria group bacterium]